MKFFSTRLSRVKFKLVVPCIGAFVFVVFSSWILFEATQANIAITQDGKRQTIKTHLNTVEELLSELDINVLEDDVLSHDLQAKLENGMEIKYNQAKRLIVTIDGEEREYHTVVKTIERFLAEADLITSDFDYVSHEVNNPITDGLNLTIKTAYPIIVNDGGKEVEFWTTGGSIMELLSLNKVALASDDKVKPALHTSIEEDTLVTITRIEKLTDTVEENLAFQVEEKSDNSLAKGEEKIISEGQIGKVLKTFEVVIENGKEVSREVVNEEVKEASKTEIIAIGTKEPQQEGVSVAGANTNTASDTNVSTASNNVSSGKVFYMNATAFTAKCSGCSGITATGINLNANPNMKVIAVDPSVIPLGSKVWVEGYGHAIAGDTGGAIKGNRIDAHVATKEAANNFGRKQVQVRIVD